MQDSSCNCVTLPKILIFDESVQGGALEIIPYNVCLILRLNAKVKVLSDVDVFFSDLWLTIFAVILVPQYFDLECT